MTHIYCFLVPNLGLEATTQKISPFHFCLTELAKQITPMDKPGLPVTFPILSTLTRKTQWETRPMWESRSSPSGTLPRCYLSPPSGGEAVAVLARSREGGLRVWSEAYEPGLPKLQPEPWFGQEDCEQMGSGRRSKGRGAVSPEKELLLKKTKFTVGMNLSI